MTVSCELCGDRRIVADYENLELHKCGQCGDRTDPALAHVTCTPCEDDVPDRVEFATMKVRIAELTEALRPLTLLRHEIRNAVCDGDVVMDCGEEQIFVGDIRRAVKLVGGE